jgi:hypothetical protein
VGRREQYGKGAMRPVAVGPGRRGLWRAGGERNGMSGVVGRSDAGRRGASGAGLSSWYGMDRQGVFGARVVVVVRVGLAW